MGKKDETDIFLENFLSSAEEFLKGKKIDRSPDARRRSRDFIARKRDADNPMEKRPLGLPTSIDVTDDE